MLLAGDIGATHTRLARVAAEGGRFTILDPVKVDSPAHPGLAPILRRYLEEHPGQFEAAGFGVPGPVRDGRARTTNLPWEVDARELETLVGGPVTLVNDVEAAAHGVLAAAPEDVASLQEGEPTAATRAVIAAGTGLGEALLFYDGGEWRPTASEGGHADFGPRDDEEVDIWRRTRAQFGRASYERLVSGPGLVLLYEFYRERLGLSSPWPPGPNRAAAVTAAAARGEAAASRALARFCSIYGAEAGNLALKALALGGVYVAGGIAPRIVDFLRRGEFLAGFRDKGPHRDLMLRIPVSVVVDERLNLRGAARAALAAEPPR